MTAGKALLAAAMSLALLVAVALVPILRNDGPDGRVVRAEFQNVGQLVPGDDVRIGGAKVGSVHDTALTDRGTVIVTLSLLDGVEAPRADASASVRAADLLGDTYLALSPGRAPRPLAGAIPPRRTFVATNLQDVFNTLDEPTRGALQSVIVELGRALDARGVDVNRAVLELAPALREVDGASRQLSEQDGQLRRLISSARALGDELAPRSRSIERLIAGLDRTLASTASRADDLDSGLQALPATLRRSRATLTALGGVASRAQPLARELGAVAAPLARSVGRLGPFARDAAPALARLRPLLREGATTLKGGRRSLRRLDTALQQTRAATPALRALSGTLTPLVEYGVKGVFGGLGALAAEPGEQGLSNVPGRNYFRGEAVIGCEMFGLPTRPGCLTDAVSGLARAGARRDRTPAARDKRRPAVTAPGRGAAPSATPPARLPTPVQQALDDVVPKATDGVQQILDFLLGP